MNLSQMQNLMNPHSNVIKKYMFDILRERYGQNEEIIERIAPSLITQNDLTDFGKLVMDIYEIAYFKAIEEQSDILKKAGIKVNITPSETKKPPSSESLFKK